MTARILPIIFASFCFALYANSITGDYLIDDTFLVRDNPYLESFSNFISFFTSGITEFGRPIRLLSFYLDTALFGKSSIGYHVSNIVYYVVFCLLVYAFCQSLFKRKNLAIAVTLLFIAHPLHTEGVAYISGRKDILGGIFSFSSLLCFIRYTEIGSRKDLLLTLLFFLLAIGSKETYAVLPFLYLIVEYYLKGNLRRHKFFFATLFLGAFLFLLYVILFRNRALFDYFHTIPLYGNNQGVNFFTAVKICGLILWLNFFPFFLSADYTFNAVKRIDFIDPAFFIAAAALLLLAIGVYHFRHRQKEISFAFLWILFCLLPVCQLIPYSEIISERSLILLSFGATVVVAALLFRLPKKWASGGLVVLLVLLSASTIHRNRVWQDDLSLWNATAKRHPDCARARYNLGVALARDKKYRAAEKEFQASLAVNPPELITVPDYSYDALLNLGNAYAMLGDFEKAKEQYQALLSHHPNHRLALKNLGIAERLEKEGQATSSGP